MKRVYGIKFLDRDKQDYKSLIQYIYQMQINDEWEFSGNTYYYPTNNEYKINDMVVLMNVYEEQWDTGSPFSYGVIVENGTSEKARPTKTIIAKIDFANSFTDERIAARKQRLLRYMEQRVKELKILTPAEAYAEHDSEMAKSLEEYKQILQQEGYNVG